MLKIQQESYFEIFVAKFLTIKEQILSHTLILPGCLVHLSPPGVVGVVDEEEDLTPQQYQGRVGGDQALHHAVQTFQGVKRAGFSSRLSTAALTLQ